MSSPEPASVHAGTGWVVIVPVKPTAIGKSRLEVTGVDRVALARAIALDTIAAARACDVVDRVVVVTDDGGLVLQAAGIPGLHFVSETDPDLREGAAPRGLDAAIGRGAASVDERMLRAALLGDLPALRPGDLAAALRDAASVDRGVVADAEGTGSTLVTARAGVPWASAFGPDSFARHVALGCAPLDLPDDSTVRRDVDTIEHLAAAAALGLGRHTSAVIAGTATIIPGWGTGPETVEGSGP